MSNIKPIANLLTLIIEQLAKRTIHKELTCEDWWKANADGLVNQLHFLLALFSKEFMCYLNAYIVISRTMKRT